MKRNLYLYKSGELKRQNNTLVYVTKSDNDIVPIHQIDHILVFGECTFNKRLLEYLNRFGITVTFFTRFGHLAGRYLPNKRKNPRMLIAQVNAFQNKQKRNQIVFSLVKGFIRNEVALCHYFQDKRKLVDCSEIISVLEAQISILEELDMNLDNYVEMAMLIEAQSKKYYYQLFNSIISDPDFVLQKRIVNPPGNYLNAMLSFGYSLLYSEILSAIDQSSIVPELSFIHGHTHHREGALHYDLSDLFKSFIIDRLCISLILEKKITEKHFYKTTSGGCFLNEEGRMIFCKEYDRLMKRTITDTRNKRNYSYKQLLKREVEVLERTLMEGNRYTPFYYKW